MKRLTVTLNFEFGQDDPPERETTFDSYVERADPDHVPERAELDQRTRIGFTTTRKAPK